MRDCCILLRIRSVAVTAIPSHILGMDKDIDKASRRVYCNIAGTVRTNPVRGAGDAPPAVFCWPPAAWPDVNRVVSLLTARGVRRADGHPICVGQLAVSRQMRRSEISALDRIEQISGAKPRASRYRPRNPSATNNRPSAKKTRPNRPPPTSQQDVFRRGAAE